MLAQIGRLAVRVLPLLQHQQRMQMVPRRAFARARRTPLSRNTTGRQLPLADVEVARDDDQGDDETDESLKAHSSSSSSSSTASAQPPAWNWVPPREPAQLLDDEVIPVVAGALLTAQEITAALVAQGAENVVVIPLQPKIESIGEFVIASGSVRPLCCLHHCCRLGKALPPAHVHPPFPGTHCLSRLSKELWVCAHSYVIAAWPGLAFRRSTRHLRKMSDSLVRALQVRLFGPPGNASVALVSAHIQAHQPPLLHLIQVRLFGPPGNASCMGRAPHIQAHQPPFCDLFVHRCALGPPGRRDLRPCPGGPTHSHPCTPPLLRSALHNCPGCV